MRKIKSGVVTGTGRRIGTGADLKAGARMGCRTRTGSEFDPIAGPVQNASSIRNKEGGRNSWKETGEKGEEDYEENGRRRKSGASDSFAWSSIEKTRHNSVLSNQPNISGFSALRECMILPHALPHT